MNSIRSNSELVIFVAVANFMIFMDSFFLLRRYV